MNGLKEKLFEIASQDEGFVERFNAAESPEAVVELLKGKGLDVTAEDLQALAQPAGQEAVELSDEELEAVAGGDDCYCVVGGGGTAGGVDRTCGCVIEGLGTFTEKNGKIGDRCICVTGGMGASRND